MIVRHSISASCFPPNWTGSLTAFKMAAKATLLRCSPERLAVENTQNDKELIKPKETGKMYLRMKLTPTKPKTSKVRRKRTVGALPIHLPYTPPTN